MADQDQLKALRLRIDSLDEKLLELISERARCAQDVARVKTQTLVRARRRCSTVPSAKPGCSSTSCN